jgi:predicted TIM-barrel fold metal-dependent hydrolase
VTTVGGQDGVVAVVDVHQHLSHDSLSQEHQRLHVERNVVFEGPRRHASPANIEAKMAAELENRLTALDEDHVQGAVIIPIHGYLRPGGTCDTAAMNDAVAGYRAKAPARFVAAVGVVEPIHGPAGYSEIERCRDELGFVGISLHGQVPTNSILMKRLVGRIGEAGLIPFIHNYGTYNETLAQVESVARDFPDLPMLVLDAFHDRAQVSLVPEVAERCQNLYFDLSSSACFEVLGLPQVRKVGAHRFLYGSNMHSLPLNTKPLGRLKQSILDSDLTVTEKSAILAGNAKRLLRLQGEAPL